MPLVILNLDERFLKGGSVESVDNLSPFFVDNSERIIKVWKVWITCPQ